MKTINYICDWCKSVLEERTEKKLVQVRSTISDSTGAYDVLMVWDHVCPTCFVNLKARLSLLRFVEKVTKKEAKKEGDDK